MTLRNYLANSSIPGYKYLDRRLKCDRYIWYLIHIMTFAFTTFMIKHTWETFMVSPTVTTLESLSFPLEEIPMPGISVCNVNKISQSRAEKYARKLSERSGTPVEEIFSNISLLGRLYEYSLPTSPAGSFISFQNFLDKYDSDTDGFFNTHEVLEQISCPCSELLEKCKWDEEAISCSDLFVTELTEEGHCCVFNYIFQKNKENNPEIIRKNNYQSVKFGKYGHLSFTIVTNTSDFFYTTLNTEASAKEDFVKFSLPMEGTKRKNIYRVMSLDLTIYDSSSIVFFMSYRAMRKEWEKEILLSLPTDYPDATSGGVREELISVGTETFIRVSTVTTVSSPESKKYPIEKRDCIFRDELSTIFGNYSYSDCIMDCKIRSIEALCRCVPFNYMNIFGNKFRDQCTLADLSCLNKHASKWKTMFPVDYSGNALDSEKQNSILCRRCYPVCSNTLYAISSDIIDILTDRENLHNFSVVHVLMEKSVGILNKQDVFFYWYDIVGLFGGICSLTIGLNFISLFEIIYFIICAFVKNNIPKNQIHSSKDAE